MQTRTLRTGEKVLPRATPAATLPVRNAVPKPAPSIQVTDRSMQMDDTLLRRPLMEMETAPSVPDFWKALQGFLRTAFPEQHSNTLFLDAKERVPGTLTLHSVPARRPAAWWKARAKLTPTHAFLNANPGIKLYNLEEIVGDSRKLKRSEFYRHVLVPEGFNKLLGLTIWEKSERKSILCLRRGFSQGRFTSGEIALLRDLHPVLHRNLRRLEKLEEEKICRSSLQQFINLLPQGILLINAHHEVVFANHEAFEACAIWNLGVEAARQLNSRAVFAVPPAFLSGYVELMEMHYAQALKQTAPTAIAAPIRRTIMHATVPHLQADLSLVSLDDPLLSRPYLFVQLLNRATLGAPAAPQAQRFTLLSQLTQREREVALLVCEGLGNEEIAERLHKSIGTIKNQLQSIFAKLGIDSRAKLISLLR